MKIVKRHTFSSLSLPMHELVITPRPAALYHSGSFRHRDGGSESEDPSFYALGASSTEELVRLIGKLTMHRLARRSCPSGAQRLLDCFRIWRCRVCGSGAKTVSERM